MNAETLCDTKSKAPTKNGRGQYQKHKERTLQAKQVLLQIYLFNKKVNCQSNKRQTKLQWAKLQENQTTSKIYWRRNTKSTRQKRRQGTSANCNDLAMEGGKSGAYIRNGRVCRLRWNILGRSVTLQMQETWQDMGNKTREKLPI